MADEIVVDRQEFEQFAKTMPGASMEDIGEAFLASKQVPSPEVPIGVEFLSGVPGAVREVAGDYVEQAKALPEMIGSLSQTYNQNLASSTGDPLSQSLQATAKTVSDIASKLPGDTTLQKVESGAGVVGRLGANMAGALALGPLFPIGSAAAGWMWDKVKDLVVTDEPPEFKGDMDAFRKEIITMAVPLVGAKVGSGIAKTGRYVYREKLNMPNKKIQSEALAAKPEGLMRVLSPQGNSAASEMLRRDLIDAQPVLVNESDNLFAGVDVKGLSKGNINPTYANQQAVKFQDNLTARILSLRERKIKALSSLEAKALELSPDLGKIDSSVVELKKIRELISDRNLSVLTQPNAAEMQEVLEGLKGDFFHDTGIISPKTGQPFILEKTYGLTEAQKILDNLYARMEEARVFDASLRHKGIADPGILAKNEALTKVLKEATVNLKNRIASSADDVMKRFPELGFQPGDINVINDTIHNLIPVRDAYKLAIIETTKGGRPSSPASLVTAVKEPGVSETFLNPVVAPIKEARSLAEINARIPEQIVGGLEEVARVSKQGPAMPMSLEVPDALTMGVGLASQTANTLESIREAERAKLLYEVSEASNKFNIDLSSFQSIQIDDGRVYIDDKNEQQDIMAILMEDTEIPRSHIAKQLSLFNDPRRENELLPLPPLKKINSKEPAVRLTKGGNKPTEYRY